MTASLSVRRGMAIFVPLAVLMLLLAGLWIIYQGEQDYRQEQQRATQVQAEILAESVTAALDFGDQATAQEAANALRANPQVQMAGIFDATDRRFAGYARVEQALPARLSDIKSSDGASIHVTVPVMRSGTRVGSVYLAGAIDPLSRRLSRYAMIALLVVMTSLVLVVLGSGQSALHRANRTLANANRDLQFQIAETDRTQEQLRQAQKMQVLGQLTGGIAHDFNNLLAIIQGSAELLQRPEMSEEKRSRFTSAIIDATTRGSLLTGQLLAFARRQPLKPEVLDINQRIRAMLEMTQPTLGPNIILKTHLEKALLPVDVDPGQFEAALLNILVNARDAMPDGGEITIRTRNVIGEEAGERERAVIVSVEDNGCGIEPAKLEQVFEPFFTTKTVGKGTGLGLSQVYGFAAQSGGEARITSEVGKGTVLTILLPASDKPLPTPPKTKQPATAEELAGRILLVEDNEAVGNLAETLLSELGHAVVRARSGPEALRLTDEGALFDIVFSDVMMPGMTGLELADKLQQRRPQLPIILTTGYSEGIAAAGSRGLPVVPKPYRVETLANAVHQALAQKGKIVGQRSRPGT
jgi:signal transduction histidine kinase/ActR/RegA family two-component response regulator